MLVWHIFIAVFCASFQLFNNDGSSDSQYHSFKGSVMASVLQIQMVKFTGPLCLKIEVFGCGVPQQGIAIDA